LGMKPRRKTAKEKIPPGCLTFQEWKPPKPWSIKKLHKVAGVAVLDANSLPAVWRPAELEPAINLPPKA
jgi:hypothetical protein